MKTPFTKAPEITRKRILINAKGKAIGRVASLAARILQGKHKPTFTPHLDDGDFVVITNAHEAILTGRKPSTKLYRHHSGYVGGLKSTPYQEMAAKKPDYILEHAIRGMLPKNKLGRQMFRKLTLTSNAEYKNINGVPVEEWSI